MSRTMNFPTVPLAELARNGITPQADPRKPVVLVVDDEAVIADTLATILSRHGFSTLVAYDGNAALEAAKLVPPDLLLTDVVMPGISGVDLAIAIRESLPNCKVLLFSGQATTVDLLLAAGEAGGDFTVLSKPLHPKDLLVRLSRTLNSQDSKADDQYLEGEPSPMLSA